MSDVAAINEVLETESPALFRALSPFGRRLFYPADIPVQAAQARGTKYNGTMGVFTDGRGNAVPLPSMESAFEMNAEDRNKAFLYSPVSGIPELRERWRVWQREGRPAEILSSVPFVTLGLAHGLSMVADLFGGEGRSIAVTTPFWANYRAGFALRTGATLRTAPTYREGRYNPEGIAEALAELPQGEPAVALLNFPSNPGGYSPTRQERRQLVDSLLGIADQRPLVVVCDDAYIGLVYDEGVPNDSLFWDLTGRHQQLITVKLDGATKEFFFFGGRVGFITFGYSPDSPVMEPLESKLKSLLRSTVGSPVAPSQMVLLQALRSGGMREEVAKVREIARQRFEVIKPLLAELDRDYLRPLPFNAGFFVLMELPEKLGLTAEEVRLYLLERHDTGIVAMDERYLRIAICSVEAKAIPEMLRRVERGVRELAAERLNEAI
jgi:aspartate/methionine/tyrosine aminotransferase